MEKVKSHYKSIVDNATSSSICPELDYKTRIIGFILSFFIGIFMILSSLPQILFVPFGGQSSFALYYTVGNLVCLSSSFFFIGPKKQWENMMKPERKLISILLLFSMLTCILLAVTGVSKLLIIIAIVVQFICLVWYVLSYIPGAQKLCSQCIKNNIESSQKEEKETEMK